MYSVSAQGVIERITNVCYYYHFYYYYHCYYYLKKSERGFCAGDLVTFVSPGYTTSSLDWTLSNVK